MPMSSKEAHAASIRISDALSGLRELPGANTLQLGTAIEDAAALRAFLEPFARTEANGSSLAEILDSMADDLEAMRATFNSMKDTSPAEPDEDDNIAGEVAHGGRG